MPGGNRRTRRAPAPRIDATRWHCPRSSVDFRRVKPADDLKVLFQDKADKLREIARVLTVGGVKVTTVPVPGG